MKSDVRLWEGMCLQRRWSKSILQKAAAKRIHTADGNCKARLKSASQRCTVAVMMAAVLLSGCYSFRGGSAPAHLKTVVIPQVNDNSGFGRSTIRFDLTTQLIDEFRSDNSLRVIDDPEADSRLEVTISTIRTDLRRAVSSDERETVRGVVIEARGTFFDNVKNAAVYTNQSFQGESSYDISEGASGEERAINEALEALTNKILLATVADW